MEENETNDCVRSRTRGSWGQRVIMRTPAISSSPAQPQPRPEENDEQRIPSEKFFCLSHQMKSVVRPCTGLATAAASAGRFKGKPYIYLHK